MLVSDPPLIGIECAPSAGLAIKAVVPAVDGGEPKPLPKIVTSDPHGPLSGTMRLIVGCGRTVAVGVAVGPGVLVGCGVSVGVGVAPNGANALKPDVMHGRSPSAKNVHW